MNTNPPSQPNNIRHLIQRLTQRAQTIVRTIEAVAAAWRPAESAWLASLLDHEAFARYEHLDSWLERLRHENYQVHQQLYDAHCWAARCGWPADEQAT